MNTTKQKLGAFDKRKLYPYEYRTKLAKEWLGARYLLASPSPPIPALIRRQAG